jgi:hypothetical protein
MNRNELIAGLEEHAEDVLKLILRKGKTEYRQGFYDGLYGAITTIKLSAGAKPNDN